MQHSPSTLMRFFVSPYEAWMYKYLREVDPDAAKEDQEAVSYTHLTLPTILVV